MRNWGWFCNSLSLYPVLFLLLILPSYFLQAGGAFRYYSSDWVPLCKHTHSCLSGPLIWCNKETQGHHSCFLSVWLSSDIRHHEAASVETDTVRISCIPHHWESSWCWQRWLHGKASPASSWADTQIKAGVAFWQRGSPWSMIGLRTISSGRVLTCVQPTPSLLYSPSQNSRLYNLKGKKILYSRFLHTIPNLILCCSVFALMLSMRGHSQGGIDQL